MDLAPYENMGHPNTQTRSGSLEPTTGVNPPLRLYLRGGAGSFSAVGLNPNNCDIIGSTRETHATDRLVNISILVTPDVNVFHKRCDFNGSIVDLLIILNIINDIDKKQSRELGVARVTCLGRKLTARVVRETPQRVCL